MLRRRHGAYYPQTPGTYTFDRMEVGQCNRKLDVFSCFITFDSSPAYRPEFYTAAGTGHELLVAWMPTKTIGFSIDDITAGVHDQHIETWLRWFSLLPGPVVIRFGHEMNGMFTRWHPQYAATDGSGATNPEQYVAAFRYLVAYHRDLGVGTNIRWMFCPNASDVPNRPENAMELYFPGVDVVDIVGYDSYNGLIFWSTPLQTMAGYTRSSQANAYDRVTALHPTAEVWVGETGCLDAYDILDTNNIYIGHRKAQWIHDLLAIPDTTLPRLTTVCWFNAPGTRNWRFGSSLEALAMWRGEFPRAGDRPALRT